MKVLLQQVVTYLAAVVIGCFIVEAGYRVHLVRNDLRIQLRIDSEELLLPFTAYTRSLWHFNAAEGFQYADRTGVYETSIMDGRIAGCGAVNPINKDQSPGISEGNYEDAEIKIALFGDSFGVFVDNNNFTWVTLLQRVLQQRLGRTVHILNFSHDGSGLIQMFDVAASELPKLKPNLAIIAFYTFATEMPRSWRTEMTIDGEPRVITTLLQTDTPDLTDKNLAYDTAILHPGIDADWCEKYKTGGALDQIGQEIVSKYLRFRVPVPRYSAFTLRRSFFWDRVVNGDAFYAGRQTTVSPLDRDKKLVDAINTIRISHVPILLVHLPVSAEVAAGKEFLIPEARSRAEELQRLIGQPVNGLLKYIGPIEHPERMNSSPGSTHPSHFGMDLYANTVSEIILNEDLLQR